MTSTPFASWRILLSILTIALVAAACGSASTGEDPPEQAASAEASSDEAAPDEPGTERVLRIGAIPDQEPERLQRTYSLLSDYLEAEIDDLRVEYVPVTEYSSAVTGFAIGDLDTVWFGGLTGVQARLEVEGANAILQRDIDESFTSVFIARADTGIDPITAVDGLPVLEGRSFSFGSESSTSGRLMPQSFLNQAGLDPAADFAGQPGFSGSHDATIEVVRAGSFEVGALNSQVWDAFDYHWVSQPDLDARLGADFTAELTEAFLNLDQTNPDHAAILELFGAGSFIETENANYEAIELVGREAGLIR